MAMTKTQRKVLLRFKSSVQLCSPYVAMAMPMPLAAYNGAPGRGVTGEVVSFGKGKSSASVSIRKLKEVNDSKRCLKETTSVRLSLWMIKCLLQSIKISI